MLIVGTPATRAKGSTSPRTAPPAQEEHELRQREHRDADDDGHRNEHAEEANPVDDERPAHGENVVACGLEGLADPVGLHAHGPGPELGTV